MIFALFCAFSAPAQTKHKRYLDYIERYKTVALQYEREFGVPASITLAQGILESSVGESKMAREANNHFGIKAYHWKGEVYGQSDTLKQVGYRKYGAPEDSFLDHAKFLTGPRYSVLYQLDVTDYRSWAQGLRDCGYAEDKDYPNKLIGIIEQYELYTLNGGSLIDGTPVAQQVEEVVVKEEQTSSRWYHRKRRPRTVEQQPQEAYQPQPSPAVATAIIGNVPSSVDND